MPSPAATESWPRSPTARSTSDHPRRWQGNRHHVLHLLGFTATSTHHEARAPGSSDPCAFTRNCLQQRLEPPDSLQPARAWPLPTCSLARQAASVQSEPLRSMAPRCHPPRPRSLRQPSPGPLEHPSPTPLPPEPPELGPNQMRETRGRTAPSACPTTTSAGPRRRPRMLAIMSTAPFISAGPSPATTSAPAQTGANQDEQDRCAPLPCCNGSRLPSLIQPVSRLDNVSGSAASLLDRFSLEFGSCLPTPTRGSSVARCIQAYPESRLHRSAART
jgi:hypothetical protein